MKSQSGNRILILCSELHAPSGGNRVIVNLANLLAEKGHEIILCIFDEISESFFPVNDTVQVIQKHLHFGITSKGNTLSRKISLVRDIKKITALVRDVKPRITITTEYQISIATVLAGIRSQTKIISWEHAQFYALEKSRFWRILFKQVYPRLNAVVCLNDDEKKLFETVNKNVKTIPNFISPVTQKYNQTYRQPIILTIANLLPVKGIDLLLQAAKIVLQCHPSWKWKVIGDGESKKQVYDFIKAENLQDKLILQLPVSSDVSKEYLNASILVMTSRSESFGMVLLEAMNFGLPCIAFDCDTGPRHIIKHNEDGLLVEKENPAKLTDAICSLIENDDRRKKMGEKAAVNIQRFSPDSVYKLWEELF